MVRNEDNTLVKDKGLVFHVGYPKTGTTTIQKKWLARYDNQLNPFTNDPAKRRLKKEMADAFRKCSPEFWKSDSGYFLAKQLADLVDSNMGCFVYSHEGLCLPYFYRPLKEPLFSGCSNEQFPVVSHLDALINTYPRLMPIKIILTLRNQAEWLPSLYSQQSNLIRSPSQNDFEARTSEILKDTSTKGSGFMDYSALVSALGRVVGLEFVHVFFLEEINTTAYWERLAQVTGLPVEATALIAPESSRENVRSTGGSEWGLRGDERYKKNNLYKKINHCKLFGKIVRQGIQFCSRKNGGSICLSDQLSREIKDQFKESNLKLQEQLGRPLPDSFW